MPTLRRLHFDDYDTLWHRSGLTSLRPQGRDSREAFKDQLNRGQIVIGLEDGGNLIGVVVATHDTRKGWINRLAIDPAHQRRGYGTMLHRVAEEALFNLGLGIIAILVEDSNEPSLNMLEKEGYRVERDILYLTKRSSAEV